MSITKAELETAVARLTAENAALRDLLAAVQETAHAGEQAHGHNAEYRQPGHRAALRISIWLDDISEQDARKLASTAAMFREHVGEVTAGTEPPAKDPEPVTGRDVLLSALADIERCEAPDGDGRWHCTLERGHDGSHFSPGDDPAEGKRWVAALDDGEPRHGASTSMRLGPVTP